MFYALKALLPKVVDMDLVLSQLAARPHVATPRTVRLAVSIVLALKHVLRLVRVSATRIQQQ